MQKVDMYIGIDSKAQAARQRKYAYYMVCKTPSGKTGTAEGTGQMVGTYHETVIQAIKEALCRLVMSCEVCIHTEDIYVASRIPDGLGQMAAADFKTRAGRPLVNANEWASLWHEVCKHQTLAVAGVHKYTEILERMMEGE